MVAFICNLYGLNSTRFFNSIINIFIFRFAYPETYYCYYHYFCYYFVLQLSHREFLILRYSSQASNNQQPRAKRMLSPYMSKTFLSILAALNITDCCTIPTFNLLPSVSIHPLKPLLMHSRAPTTTGTTSTYLSDQNLFSSLFKF